MAQLGRLWRALNLLGAARDLAIEKRRYEWDTLASKTFYLNAERADIHLQAHDEAHILTTIELRGGFAWQIATDQDEAGVYIIARRKAIIGSIARAKIAVWLPPSLHITLELANCRLCMDELRGKIELPPELYESP